MKRWRIEVIVGIVLVLGCPFIPHDFYNWLSSLRFFYDTQVFDWGLMPTITIVGIMIFILGITDRSRNQ